MVGVVAVADHIALHLADDLLKRTPFSGDGTLREPGEVFRRGLVDDRPVRQVAIALKEVAYKAHGGALDLLLHLRLAGVHGRPPSLRSCGTALSSLGVVHM